MELTYKSRSIHTSPQLDLEADCWVPSADVSWDEAGKTYRQLLIGPTGYFKVIDQAESYALDMAITWIDAECVENLTP